MKSTTHFKQTIEAYLQHRASTDPLFAKSYAKENKNIDHCITYILNTVQQSGCAGFADDEIYYMAAHYYDENDINVGDPIDAKVIVNHTVEISEEEIQEAKQKAINQVMHEQRAKLTKPVKTKKTNPPLAGETPSLFDF